MINEGLWLQYKSKKIFYSNNFSKTIDFGSGMTYFYIMNLRSKQFYH